MNNEIQELKKRIKILKGKLKGKKETRAQFISRNLKLLKDLGITMEEDETKAARKWYSRLYNKL